MIIFLIFLLHFIFILYIFIKKYKKDSLGSAIQNAIFIIIIFSVGWTLFTLILNMLIEPQGLGTIVIEDLWGKHKDQLIPIDRDTIILTLLTIAEFFFFKNHYKDIFTSSDKEKQ